MSAKRNVPPQPPRIGRRTAAAQESAAAPSGKKETATQRRARVLDRTRELISRARRGETPEEIIDKGLALKEVKELAPWEYDGTGNYGGWVQHNLSYGKARANQLVAIATGVKVQRVRGTLLCFEQLRVICKVPDDQQEALIQAAAAGLSAAALQRLVEGTSSEDDTSSAVLAGRVLRRHGKQAGDLRDLVARVRSGHALPPGVLRQFEEDAAVQMELIRQLGGFRGQQVDPFGSTAPPLTPTNSGTESVARATAASPSAPTATVDPNGSAPPSAEPDRPAPPAEDTGPHETPAPPETIAERNARLAEDYEPEPVGDERAAFDIPAHWPPDWVERWINSPAEDDHILLCTSSPTPQSGSLGRTIPYDIRTGIDLNGSLCGFIFSNPGAGKTYACDNMTHMALAPLNNINRLPRPLCGIMVHYHPDETHDPEALSLRHKNQVPGEVIRLVEEMGSHPDGLIDIVVLCSPSRVEYMRKKYPHVQAFPMLPATEELGMAEIQALLGINDPHDNRLYTRQLRQAVAGLREASYPSVDALEAALLSADLLPEVQRLVKARIGLLRPHVCDASPLRRLPRPGRLIIIDPRDPLVGKEDALTMATITLSILSRRDEQRDFNLLVRIDELHEFLGHRAFMALLGTFSRKRRHLWMSLLFSTQYPQKIPKEMLTNADLIGVGRMQSQEALNHIGKVKTVFSRLRAGDTATLGDGEFLFWTERVWVNREVVTEMPPLLKLKVRAQNAQHGGATRRAVAEEEMYDEGEEQAGEDEDEAGGLAEQAEGPDFDVDAFVAELYDDVE